MITLFSFPIVLIIFQELHDEPLERKVNFVNPITIERKTFVRTPLTESPNHKVPTNRPDEHWLVYVHKTKPNCRIAQFDKNHFLFIEPKKRKSNLRNHFYPIYLGKGIHGVTLLNGQKKESVA